MNQIKNKYFNKYNKVFDEYMEDRGEGKTMASQIVTAIYKLIYMWYKYGDVYDNNYYLIGWANDISSYANWLYKYIPKSQIILDEIEEAEDKFEYEFILKELASKFLKKDFLKSYAVLPAIDSIFDTWGKFQYDDARDDFDEDGYCVQVDLEIELDCKYDEEMD